MFLLETRNVKVGGLIVIVNNILCKSYICCLYGFTCTTRWLSQELSSLRVPFDQRDSLTQSVYDEIVRSILAILDRLDLTSTTETTAADDVNEES